MRCRQGDLLSRVFTVDMSAIQSRALSSSSSDDLKFVSVDLIKYQVKSSIWKSVHIHSVKSVLCFGAQFYFNYLKHTMANFKIFTFYVQYSCATSVHVLNDTLCQVRR